MIPSSASVSFRPDLMAVVNEWALNLSDLIADLVLPFHDGNRLIYEYPIIPAEERASIPDARRATATAAKETTTQVERGTGECSWYSLRELVPDRRRVYYDTLFQLDEEAATSVAMSLLLAREKRVSDLIINTTTWPTSGQTGAAAGNAWTNKTSATPLVEMNRGFNSVPDRCGQPANCAIIHRETLGHMMLTDEVTERMPGAPLIGAGGAKKLLADLLGVEHVLTPGASYNAANAGADFSASAIWPKNYVWIGRIGDLKSRLPCVGVTYACQTSSGRLSIKDYRDEHLEGLWIEGGMDVSEKILNSRCGYLISGVNP